MLLLNLNTETITKGFEIRSTEMMIFNAELAGLFIVVWPGLYFLLHKVVLSEKSPDFARRVLCIVHWFTSFCLSTALYCEHFDFKEKSMDFKFEDVAIMNALVYLTFDMIWNMWYETETGILFINHLVLVSTAGLYIFRDTMRMVFIEGYTLITLTEPLLHLRYFLRYYNKDCTKAEYVFIGTFLFIRAGVLTFGGAALIAAEEVDNIDKTLLLAIYTTGLVFSINLVGYIQRKHEEKDLGHILRGVGAHPHPDLPT